MPAQKGKSTLLAKLGDRLVQAHETHKVEETTYSEFGELPDGIEGGVAKLVDCLFDTIKPGKDNAGELFFRAAGVVVEPAEFKGMRVAGLRTSIMEALYDTPDRAGRKTVDEHYAWILNELRKLGLDTTQVAAEDMESVVAAMKDANIYFRFRTWKGKPTAEYPNPRTNHVWNGIVQDYVEPAAGDGVVDNTSRSPAPAPSANGSTHRQPAAQPEAEDIDITTLGVQADAGDGDAQNRLEALAGEAGVDPAAVAAAQNWASVVGMIEEAQGGNEAAAAAGADEPQWVPQAGEVYKYTPSDPKNPKKAMKPVDVEVMEVDEAGQTVKLKNIATPKVTYPKVPWDKLEQA